MFYRQNADGIRVQKHITDYTADTTESHYYDYNGTQLVAERWGSNIIWFLYDESGSAVGLTYNGTEYYYLKDLQGDITGIADASGNILAEYAYDVWGKLLSVTDAAGNDISADGTHIANINPLRYRGYYYDSETGLYYLLSRYYDPETGRFVNADGVVSGSGDSVQGYNLFAYCFNNPVNLTDETGNWPSWSDVGNFFKGALKKVSTFVKNTFGAGVVQSQSYETVTVDTIVYGKEDGVSTSKVISGDVSKPVSVYVETASKWWKLTEYKVGVQFNIGNGGFSFATNTAEASLTVSSGNSSLQLVSGVNKIGYTTSSGVSFGKRTADAYVHEYIRPIPTMGIAAGVVAGYHWGGTLAASLISIFGGGFAHGT